MGDQRIEIRDVFSPPDRSVTIDWRLPTATLVVIVKASSPCEGVKLREQVIDLGPGAAVQNDGWGSVAK